MSVVYRLARAQDLKVADSLVVSSINDLTERYGFGSPAASSPPKLQLFSLEDDPRGLWVAEEGEKMLGFAWSWVCGDMWFLAQLFVSPDQQRRNIGNELIKRTLEHAEASGASNRVLITFSFNPISQGLYIRHGMLPRFPIYGVDVARQTLIGRLRDSLFDVTPIEEDTTTLRRLAEADKRSLGVSREKHHRYLINDSATRGFNLYAGGDWFGYVYVDAGGHVGPLAVMDPKTAATAFTTALHLALESGSSRISAFLPGANKAVLDIAFDSGMLIKLPMLLMSSQDFGNWEQYLPRNPGFM